MTKGDMTGADAARGANEERGELALVLDGQDMVLRPSHEAIRAFEAATGKGLLQLAREAMDGTLTLSETAQVACECIRAWGREEKNLGFAGSRADRIALLIMESDGGLFKAMATIAALLSLAATGGCTATGEVKPATRTSGEDVAG